MWMPLLEVEVGGMIGDSNVPKTEARLGLLDNAHSLIANLPTQLF